jgi:hypothetical protein
MVMMVITTSRGTAESRGRRCADRESGGAFGV